jgi:hypothetical protein
MKKTFFLAGIISLLFTLAVNAQDTTSNKPATQDTTPAQQTQPMTQDQKSNPAQTQPMTQDQKSNPAQTQPMTQDQKSNPAQTTTEQKKYGNPTVDSILSKYTLVPMPNQMTTEQIFPVIGQYQSTSNADQKITVTLDDQNKGFAWIDGLPQGKLKAVLKKSPATYKIPAQKTADGKDVPEGTMIYDKDTKQITVLIGRPYNDQDPASVFAMASTNPTDQTQTASNDQTTAVNNQDTNAQNDHAKMDNSKMKVTKAKTTNHKTKTKEVKKEEPPFVFTGTKIEQTTAANNQ